ncbi:MAG: YajQ family cyclic di-GMP-binding protein [Candidatus Marinimicrobia bacterium]|nr:YajQ family cyclic di-GMP-binding protein [Candidatus Neomarinimicrobiota bacterium]
MPSFDIVNQINLQEVDNAVNNTLKEVARRYDFRDTNTQVNLNRQEKKINLVAGSEMQMETLQGMLVENFAKRKVSGKNLKFGQVEATAHGDVKCVAGISEGIDKESARKIVKMIKEQKMKVQPAIQDNQVRVTGKKIDDLQAVIGLLKGADLPVPLQFVNLK